MLDKRTVLTIDDSDTIRNYLHNVLAPKGATVQGASTGQQGLEMCAQGHYDLVLLDLLMPDMDGIEVLKLLRSTNDTSTIVMLTGHGGIKSAIAAVQMGADGYIEKQEITSTARDHIEFLYALEQAMEHRAGVVARKLLETVRADFYAMVTHDLRNPTTIILMASTMLTDGSVEPLTPRQLEFVSMVDEAAGRLLHLINDYLDFAKIDAGYLRLDLAEVDLCQVVESSAHFVRLQTQVKRQTLTLDLPVSPLTAWVDAERLKQVLGNLLSNAVKYTPEGGCIVLQMRAEGQQALFRVSDNGIGISSDQLPKLFTKYNRILSENTRRITGSGLGLVIVKEIVEAHGGSIHVETEGIDGKGTTFVFSLPLERIAQRPKPPETAAGHEKHFAKEIAVDLPDLEDAKLYQIFVQESLKQTLILQDIFRQLYDAPQDRQLISVAQRTVHTLKGNAGAMHFSTIQEMAAQMDDLLRQADRGKLVLTPIDISNLTRILSQLDLALTIE